MYSCILGKSKVNIGGQYSIEDLQGDVIKGRFYNSELISVNKNIEYVRFLEKILKKRKHKGKTQYFVNMDGFPNKFNSWVDSDEIIDSLDSGTYLWITILT